MNTYLRRFYLFLALIIVFASCDDYEDVPPQTDDEYFVSKKDITSYSVNDINTMLNLASTVFPDLADLLSPISGELTMDIKLVKITYKTTFNGEDIMASGVVSIPNSEGSYPLLSFQNGTNTLHSAAPSESDYSLLSQNNVPLKLLSMMASAGFVIAIPDYLGFGDADNMFHPYLDEASTVQSIADMLKAVVEMLAKDESVNLNNDLYIQGYSQGGWASMALQRSIDNGSLNNFNLKASACNAGPHYLIDFTDWLLAEESYPMPYFLAYLYNSYMNLDMTTPIDSIFQQPYADKVPTLFDGSMSGDEINNELTTTVADLFTPGFIENWNKGGIYESLYNMLEENSNGGYSTSTPMLLIHGGADTYVPAFMSENLHTDFLNNGVSQDNITLMILPGLDHTDAIVPAGLLSINWFIDIKDE
jgi:pimeloyl-ACP methyl ester carboxylesterase